MNTYAYCLLIPGGLITFFLQIKYLSITTLLFYFARVESI